MAERPLRVLVMIHRLTDNSPYCFFVHEQAKALAASGIDVQVVSPVPVPLMASRLRPESARVIAATPDEAVVDGIPVSYPRFMTLGNAGERVLGGRLMARAALRVARKLHAQKPFDIVHAHMLPRDGHAGLIVARELGVPCALTVHGTDILHYFIPSKRPWRRNIRIAQNVDALMAVSGMLRSRVQPYRDEEKLTRVVPNGVDLSLVPKVTENTPRAVISVGTLKARKCMDRTIAAFARLAGEFPDATLTIVGVGELREQLERQIEELGLTGRATLTGGLAHEDVLRAMGKSDLFVLPSWGEGYGIVYIEAMAAGCIAVGAKDEGIEDTIADGENGFLVPAGDVDAIERVMRDVFTNRGAYDALRERGRRDARALTWARNAGQTEAVYREAIGRFAQKQGRRSHG